MNHTRQLEWAVDIIVLTPVRKVAQTVFIVDIEDICFRVYIMKTCP